MNLFSEQYRQRKKKLREVITYHNDLYYNKAEPEITDKEYDDLFSELKELEKKYPEELDKDSPTNTVGLKKNSKFPDVKHLVPMLSINNSYSDEDIIRFANRVESLIKDNNNDEFVEYVVEMKFDGIAFTAFYEQGKLVRVATRGDGISGEDITNNAKNILNLPHNIYEEGILDNLEVRGEIYLPRSAFAKLVKEQEKSEKEKIFANPRNAAAGTIKLLDSKEISKRGLKVFLYQIVADSLPGIKNQFEVLAQLNKWGFPIGENYRVAKNAQEILMIRDDFAKIRHKLDYDTDGLVIKVNSIDQQQILGLAKRTPNWAIAFKFEPEKAETVVENIRLQVGKLGKITPIADLKPVFLSGSTITHAALHNESYIKDKDIRINDHVWVEKAAEIIPQIRSVIKDKRSGSEQIFQMSEKCPICHEKLKIVENKNINKNITVSRFCVNKNCPGKNLAKIINFTAKKAMDIEWLGPANVEELIENNLIENPADIYRLTKKDLLPLTVLGRKILEKNTDETSKSVENILNAIEKSKDSGLARLLVALTIPNLGETTAQILAKKYKNIDNIIEADTEEIAKTPAGETQSYRTIGKKSAKVFYQVIHEEKNIQKIKANNEVELEINLENLKIPGFSQNKSGKKITTIAKIYKNSEALLKATEDELAMIKLGTSNVSRTLGTVLAKSIKNYFAEEDNKKLINDLKELGVKTYLLDDKHISGNLPLNNKVFVLTGKLKNYTRGEATKLIEEKGGIVGKSISRNIDYLVVGEEAGSKLLKAEELGISVLKEQDFNEMLEKNKR